MKMIKVFNLNDLTLEQKKAYIAANSEKFDAPDSWYEYTCDSVKEALEKIGFYNVVTSFSGFWSQGDGAQFTGNYSYEKGVLSAIKKEYPQWAALHTLAKTLQELEKLDFYSISFNITRCGNYSHEMATSFEFEDSRRSYGWVSDTFESERESLYLDACRDFMREFYTDLENEYNTLISEENILEDIENEVYDYIEITEKELETL